MNEKAAKSSQGYGTAGCYHDYTGVPVLANVNFFMRPGEVHGLMGENGSGKSTLIKILTGVVEQRRGMILLDGETVKLSGPRSAQQLGIGVVHQDYHLFPELTVAQNIFGVNAPMPRKRWTRAMDRTKVERTVESLLEELRIEIPSTRPVHQLGPPERKFVEIAGAMILRPQFLILDEPTASLEPTAARSVLEMLDRLRQQGVGLCFVSHRLDEVTKICDRITVIRDGVVVGDLERGDADEGKLANLITGGMDEIDQKHRRDWTPTGDIALKVSQMTVGPGRPEVGFEVEKGEIFGLTGLLGAGAETIVRMLGGAEPPQGNIEIGGKRWKIRTPVDAQKAGIGYIPEDRKNTGLIREQSVALNISLPSLSSVSRAGILNHNEIDRRAERYKEDMSIKTQSIDSPIWTLSGGNQQKVMLGKWLASGAGVLAIEEPTHGVDVGAKVQVHDLLREYADAGGTVVVASTDVGEVLEICDRIGVMRHGELTHIVSAEDLTKASATVLGTTDAEQMLEALIETDTDVPLAA
ncbi:MAG: sugar ABC transporter ATP-binding protein [Solirubrobacterales bacterium]